MNEVPSFIDPAPEPREMSEADRTAVLKAKLLHDFLFFTRWFFKKREGKKFVVAPHHIAIADALTKVVTGEINRLIINIPPRYGKTELAVKMFLAWILANNPSAKSIHISYSDDLALDNSSSIRDIVKSGEFQELFPMRLRLDSDSKKKWYTFEGGGLYSVAAGGAITGFGAGALERIETGSGSPADGFAGVIIIDDPIKPDDAFSETMLDNVNRRFNNTIASRTNSKTTPIIVIMQRLHEDDLSGFLLDGGSGEEWVSLCLPVIDDEGEPLWPDKHDLDRLKEMEAADPYTFAGQYMQRPSPLGGGMFKDEWWRYHKVPPATLWRNIYADTAQKVKESNDYSVLQCWGKTTNGIVLLDQLRGKWAAPELLKRATEFWNKHKVITGMGTLRAMKIEDKASGTGLIQQLQSGSNIPVVAIQRNIDKVLRAGDAAPWVSSGRVSIPEDEPWINDYVHEFSAFPNGKNDDQIDPTMDAIADMLQGGEMQFIPSDTIARSMAAGSGAYLGNDPLICGVYIAKSADETSYIQFRRGKDAMSEVSYEIGWGKTKKPMVVVSLLTTVLGRHKPDMTFISESGMGGIISDRLSDMGYTVIRVSLLERASEELKYKDILAESCWRLRNWMIDGGSISQDQTLEQHLVSLVHGHDKKDRLIIETPNPRASSLALTFAHDVPPRYAPRGQLDTALGTRGKANRDYNPLDEMDMR